MLRNSTQLEECAIGASDGMIGDVMDLYFDDEAWVIRYLVVSTGEWLANRKVLISPFALGRPQWAQRLVRASITREQVKNSPDIDTDRPVSRQHEVQHGSTAPYYQRLAEQDKTDTARRQSDDPRPRSCNAVVKCRIQANDGEIGHVRSLLFDDETWAIRYLIVDTSHWWLGHQVLVAPQWIKEVNGLRAHVSVDLSRKVLKNAPQFAAGAPLGRAQEMALLEYYGRWGYWAHDVERAVGHG